MHLYTCSHTHTCMCTNMHAHTCVCMCAPTLRQAHTIARTHARTHARMHACTHAHTHTHTQCCYCVTQANTSKISSHETYTQRKTVLLSTGGEVMLNVLRCQLTYEGQIVTNAEARFNNSLCPRKPEGLLGQTAQDVHLDSHTAPEL